MSWLMSKLSTGSLILIYILVLLVLSLFIPWTGNRDREYSGDLRDGTVVAVSHQDPFGSYVMLPNDQALASYLQSYLLFPDPHAVLQRYMDTDIESFYAESQYNDEGHSVDLLTTFYSHLLHDNPELVAPFAEKLITDDSHDRAITGAAMIALSDHDERLDLVASIIETHISKLEERRLISQSFDQAQFFCPSLMPGAPGDLDFLWACYFASGDTFYLEKITWALEHHQGGQKEVMERITSLQGTIDSEGLGEGSKEYQELIQQATAYAAWYSLNANAKDYLFVKQALKRISKVSQDNVAQELSLFIK
jgi:hypothetical protein